MEYHRYGVSRAQKAPLLAYMREALETCGCRILRCSASGEAPFRISFEAPDGERMGIIAYAFFANSQRTRNRPDDEHRFQVKYGQDNKQEHELWQDPYEVYTTLFLGIDPERGVFVGADPVLHSPTRFFISVEYKEEHVRQIQEDGWAAWERIRRGQRGEQPIEILVGGVRESFLRYVRFERAAKGMDPGHRQLLAEKIADLGALERSGFAVAQAVPNPDKLHQLSEELQLTHSEILDLIESAPRLKMAVRGWVAEVHLERELQHAMAGIAECYRVEEEGRPDIEVRFPGAPRPIYIECKNVLRKTMADGTPRLDFQRTRASKGDPCSRYYRPEDFDVVAACLHPITEDWSFQYVVTSQLDAHKNCVGRLNNNVRIDQRWSSQAREILSRVASA